MGQMSVIQQIAKKKKAFVREKKKIQIRFPKRSFWTRNMKKKRKKKKKGRGTEIEYPLTKS